MHHRALLSLSFVSWSSSWLLAACSLPGSGSSSAEADLRAPPTVEPTPAHLPLDAPGGLADAVGEPVSIEARDLVLRLEGAEVHVPYLSGHLAPARGGQLVDLESPRSFEVTIDALEVRIPTQTLQQVMVPRGGKVPFRDLVVRTEGNSVVIDGRAGRAGLPFTFRADPRVTPQGTLGLELEKVRVLGVGVRGFLGAFQDPIEKAANKRGHLLDIDAEWLVINPFPFAGPPAIHARFTSVEVREHDIVARLGTMTPREEGEEGGGLLLRGGALRTQKAVFFGADIRLEAQDGGALIVDPEHMADQIAGGVVKNTKDGDLTVYVLAPGQKPVEAVEVPPGGPEEARTPPE